MFPHLGDQLKLGAKEENFYSGISKIPVRDKNQQPADLTDRCVCPCVCVHVQSLTHVIPAAAVTEPPLHLPTTGNDS